MADIKYALADYKIAQVGPSESFTFKGNDGGDVQLTSVSLQLEGVAEWVKLTQKPETALPNVGDSLRGHVEDTGKYGMKFVKERTGGGWSGGGKSSPGAQFNAAVEIATDIVIGYYTVTATKPKDITEMLDRIEQLAPKMKAMVDKFAGTEAKPASPEITKDSLGEGNPDDKVVIEDVDEKELKW